LSAGTATSVYSFDISSLRTSVTEAKSLLADLEQAALRVTSLQQGASAPSGTSAASGAGVAYQRQAQSAQQAADAALRLASAEARGIAIQGDLAGSAQRLSVGIQQYRAAMDGSTQSMIRLQTAENQLASTQQRLASGSTGLAETLKGIQSSLGTVGLAFGAQQLVQGTLQLTQLGAQAQETRAAFDRLAVQAHTTGDALLTALRQSSHGEISDLNLELSANRAQLLGVAHDAQTMGTLLEFSRLRAKALGIDAGQAFDNIVTGLGRASPLILDNLGITIKLGEVHAEYAKSVGKSVDALTDQEKKTALVNAIMKQAQAEVAAAGSAAETNAEKIAKFNAALDNLKASFGGLAANRLGPVAADAAKVADALNGTATAFQGLQAGASVVQQLGNTFGSVLGPIGAYNSAVVNAVGSLFHLDTANKAASASTTQQAQAAQQAAQATAVEGAAEDALAGRITAASSAIQKLSADTQASAQASVDDTAKKELQTAQTQLLEAQTTAAANAFIAGLNPGMSASAAAAAAAAAGLSPLIAQLVGVKIAAAEARAQLLALTNQQNTVAVNQAIAANRAAGRMGRGDAGDTRLDREEYGKQLAAQRDAEINLAKAQGDRNKEIALLRNEQVGMNKDSADYINLQAKIIDIETQGAKKGGKGTKLSDQARLNNSLLDLETKQGDDLENLETENDNQLETLAREHNRKLLDIDQQYHDKARQAERDFGQSQLDDRAGFYEQLINMQGKGGQKLARELSAQYEQAVTKSEQIGREKGADAGQAYMTAAEAAITKEGRLKEEINKALTGEDGGKKDKARAEALQGVLALQQRADQARLAAVEQSGSQIANERDRQIADENARYTQSAVDQQQKYEDAQDRIQTKADQTAARKEAAAVRAKQHVDVETLAWKAQTEAIQENADAASRAGNAALAAQSGARPAQAAVARSASAPTVPRAAAQIDFSAVVDAINSLHGKLDAIIGAEGDGTNATRDVVAALGRALQVRVTNFPSNYGRAMT
jgi:hypothetical protein